MLSRARIASRARGRHGNSNHYIFTMGNPKTGYYECPRCSGRDVYESEEITGAMAMTLNTPGPVDPTIVNPVKGKVTRCRNCREKVKWHDSAETIAYKQKRESKWNAYGGTPAGALMCLASLALFFNTHLFDWGAPLSTGEKVFAGVLGILGVIYFFVGVDAIRSIRKQETSNDD